MLESYLNFKDYGATGDGRADDTAALNECMKEAQRTKQVCYLPSGIYRVRNTLCIGSKESNKLLVIQGTGNSVIYTDDDIDMARTNTDGKVKIKEVSFRHEGKSGSCLYLDDGFGHDLYGCSFSNITGNISTMLIFNGSYTDIVNCAFENAEPESYSINCTTIPGKININSNIFDCRIYGTGKGLLINSSENNRPEGLKVARNMFLNTGKEQITVNSILHLDISNNMLDQSSKVSILIDPKMQGICQCH